jgi:5-methylcytosine-specific restriction endonuclease McrA
MPRGYPDPNPSPKRLKQRIAAKRFRKRHLERIREEQKEAKRVWRDSHRAEDRLRVRQWQLKYPEKCRALKARYKYFKKRNTPKWVNRRDLDKLYVQCPAGLEVDHIIPLRGENVSGLHVPWNLQYLNPEDNVRKSNSFDGTYNNEGWRIYVKAAAA